MSSKWDNRPEIQSKMPPKVWLTKDSEEGRLFAIVNGTRIIANTYWLYFCSRNFTTYKSSNTFTRKEMTWVGRTENNVQLDVGTGDQYGPGSPKDTM